MKQLLNLTQNWYLYGYSLEMIYVLKPTPTKAICYAIVELPVAPCDRANIYLNYCWCLQALGSACSHYIAYPYPTSLVPLRFDFPLMCLSLSPPEDMYFHAIRGEWIYTYITYIDALYIRISLIGHFLIDLSGKKQRLWDDHFLKCNFLPLHTILGDTT